MVRLVFFVASHVHPPQVIRLARALRSGSRQSRVLINHDYRVSHLDPATLVALDGVELAEQHHSPEWGWFSPLLLNTMRWVESHYEYDWLVYLSGQDYPLMPVPEIEAFLEATRHDGFVGLHRLVDPTRIVDDWDREFVSRYYLQYVPLPRLVEPARLPRLVRGMLARARRTFNRAQLIVQIRAGQQGTRPRIGVRAVAPPFTGSFRCYKGSCWWTLSRRAVRHALRFIDEHPGFLRHYSRTFAANESMFQSIFFNASGLDIHRDSMRFIRWTGGSAHPDVLRASDFPAMIASGKHFARKIDGRVDPELLDLLAAHLGERAAKAGLRPAGSKI